MEKRGPVDAGLAPVGWALIGFGVATWAVALTIFEPALSALVGSRSRCSRTWFAGAVRTR